MVILANHYGLSQKAYEDLLEQEIKMNIKIAVFMRGLQNKQLQQFVDMLGCVETNVLDRKNSSTTPFSRAEVPTSMKDTWRLFTRNKSSIMKNMLLPIVREVGDTASVSLVGAVDRLLMMGIDFFISLQTLWR